MFKGIGEEHIASSCVQETLKLISVTQLRATAKVNAAKCEMKEEKAKN